MKGIEKKSKRLGSVYQKLIKKNKRSFIKNSENRWSEKTNFFKTS